MRDDSSLVSTHLHYGSRGKTVSPIPSETTPLTRRCGSSCLPQGDGSNAHLGAEAQEDEFPEKWVGLLTEESHPLAMSWTINTHGLS